MNLKDFMEIVGYRITEGDDYGWSCFGSDSYMLDSWDGDNENGYTITVVFDTRTQTVYQMEACDYKRQKAYRFTNPEFKAAFDKDVGASGLADQAWDGVDFIDLDVYEDFVEKASAIVRYDDYDDRIQMQIDLPGDELFMLMKMAHERDITFNQFVEMIFVEEIEKLRLEREVNDNCC